MSKDYCVSRLRVVFTIWILLYHSWNEYILNDVRFNIHQIPSLEIIKSITFLVLKGFVFISGILLAKGFFERGKYQNKTKYCLDRGKRLLLPYFFWSFFGVLIYPTPPHNIVYGWQHLWFLLMLFDVSVIGIVIIPLLRKSNYIVDAIFLYSLIVLSAVLNKCDFIQNYLGIKGAVGYMTSFFFGVICVKYKLCDKLANSTKWIFYPIFMTVTTLTLIVMLCQSIPFGSFYDSIPGYMFLLLLYVLFKRTLDNTSTSTLTNSLDRDSLGIYILHQFVGKYTLMFYFPAFITFYDNHCVLAPLLLFIFMFLMAWMVSRLLHKNKYTAMLIGG